MLVIDGSIGEGGGQILRYSLAIVSVLRKNVKITNIRAKRRNPGLQPQHLTGVKAVATLTNADVEGAYKGSMELIFKPRTLKGGNYVFDVGTAGSVTLVLQSLLPILPFLDCKTSIEIRGGTDVPMSPPIDYVRYVLVPLLSMLGYKIEVEVVRRGHYPRGGGIVRVRVNPTYRLESIDLVERGDIEFLGGRSHCVKLPSHVAERQAKAAKEYLLSKGFEKPINIDVEYYEPSKDFHLGPGSGIVVYSKTTNSVLGGDALGMKGKPAEEVGREAAEKLFTELISGAAVDKHAGDMLVPLMSLAKGTSRITVSTITSHLLTALDVIKIVTGVEAYIKEYQGKGYLVQLSGLGVEV
ncbi:MAG: RNA 3'-terminal phosphate cyclase [Ignisphaera sp.]|uniref:RNA 3'-terminal phosphate cyclase n=1 Tax=Ignisphaera aggregans TaxID=334771 RepID=A0A7C4JJ89_9CREN